ncbi:hypothetical protein GCM10009105_05840 [Dokdonella soli]|uniref:Uncharacterized protein n=1 Tax=Dokdonella soli TaxID=529810 RepID=A0ABN1ICP0_9GAMM
MIPVESGRKLGAHCHGIAARQSNAEPGVVACGVRAVLSPERPEPRLTRVEKERSDTARQAADRVAAIQEALRAAERAQITFQGYDVDDRSKQKSETHVAVICSGSPFRCKRRINTRIRNIVRCGRQLVIRFGSRFSTEGAFGFSLSADVAPAFSADGIKVSAGEDSVTAHDRVNAQVTTLAGADSRQAVSVCAYAVIRTNSCKIN